MSLIKHHIPGCAEPLPQQPLAGPSDTRKVSLLRQSAPIYAVTNCCLDSPLISDLFRGRWTCVSRLVVSCLWLAVLNRGNSYQIAALVGREGDVPSLVSWAVTVTVSSAPTPTVCHCPDLSSACCGSVHCRQSVPCHRPWRLAICGDSSAEAQFRRVNDKPQNIRNPQAVGCWQMSCVKLFIETSFAQRKKLTRSLRSRLRMFRCASCRGQRMWNWSQFERKQHGEWGTHIFLCKE